jgi:hypothetical protein
VSQYADRSGTPGWPVDGHVHLHAPSLVEETLDAAALHFAAAGGARRGLLGALLLTQMSRERVFETLAERSHVGRWSLARAAGEDVTLIATHDERQLALVCGRQVRVRGGIEISGLGTTAKFADGAGLADTIEAVRASGALMMMPWGFGKWTGARGRDARDAMLAHRDSLFVGDSGCRLSLARTPPLVTLARAEGMGVIAGTDPFPFLGDHRRVGSFGFLLDSVPPVEAPWRHVRARLESGQRQPPIYGRPTGLGRFLTNQLGVHLANRMRKVSPA